MHKQKNPKLHQNVLELINEFNKVEGYNISTHKIVAFYALIMNLLEMIAFTIAINTKMFRSKSHQGSKSYPR
jgi:hypothetical protein